jgi:hypothetical protein
VSLAEDGEIKASAPDQADQPFRISFLYVDRGAFADRECSWRRLEQDHHSVKGRCSASGCSDGACVTFDGLEIRGISVAAIVDPQHIGPSRLDVHWAMRLDRRTDSFKQAVREPPQSALAPCKKLGSYPIQSRTGTEYFPTLLCRHAAGYCCAGGVTRLDSTSISPKTGALSYE